MFNNKKSKSPQSSDRRSTSGNINVIGADTKIIGDIISKGDFRIDGDLEGTIKTNGRIIVGIQGVIKGRIECENADIEGKVSGDFIVHQALTAKSTAVITGDVTVGQISTEPGASFNATCNMKGAVKAINSVKNNIKERTA